MMLRASRLSLVALTLVSSQASADNMSAEAFVVGARRDISGKTGDPVRIIEVLADGRIFLKDGGGVELVGAHLSTADLDEFQNLLSDRNLLTGIPPCDPAGSDLPETEFVVEYADRAVSVRISISCPLPPGVDKLDALFEAAEQKHFPEG